MPNEPKEPKEPLNPGRKDFDDLSNRIGKIEDSIGGFAKKLDGYFNDGPNKKPVEPNNPPKEPKKPVEPKKPTEPKKPSNSGLDEDSKKRLEELEQWKADQDKREKHNHLMDFAKNTAKEKGINLDNSIESFLGEDEDTTKANIEAVAKDFSNIKPSSTEGGFKTSSSLVKDGKGFMNDLMDKNFGPKTKE